MKKNQKFPIPNYQLRQIGFTLLELLIALAISSIIFLAIISTYSLTMRMVEKWDRREENYYLARNIFKRMHSEISSLYSFSDSNNHSGLETSTLGGDEKTFSFYTASKSLYFPFSCLMKVTYKFVISDEGKGLPPHQYIGGGGLLTREEEPLVNFSLEENVNLKSYVWSENLKDCTFQYSDGTNWQNSWDFEKKDQTLKAVKITLISPHEETFSTIIYIPTEN